MSPPIRTKPPGRLDQKQLPEEGFQFGLDDSRNLTELIHPFFPSERLPACHKQDLTNRHARPF
ncbi:MAG: hypothetical protein HQL89_14110 [Magnetococcales bacterium]|nr:hypothetical protein [Magnetococcales bacterium]